MERIADETLVTVTEVSVIIFSKLCFMHCGKSWVISRFIVFYLSVVLGCHNGSYVTCVSKFRDATLQRSFR